MYKSYKKQNTRLKLGSWLNYVLGPMKCSGKPQPYPSEIEALNKKIKELDLDRVISEMKPVKVGRGVDFLPRETPDLLKKLKEWAMEFAKDGTAALRQKILSVLDELLFRKVITNKEHKDIKEDSKINQIS